ncbi:hypothetical protein BC829DRAFT_442878 [Chytridium lagenaria]|nr:hypothetical protein BC829DRAFT_442878 [Chytridium lagenaria]
MADDFLTDSSRHPHPGIMDNPSLSNETEITKKRMKTTSHLESQEAPYLYNPYENSPKDHPGSSSDAKMTASPLDQPLVTPHPDDDPSALFPGCQDPHPAPPSGNSHHLSDGSTDSLTDPEDYLSDPAFDPDLLVPSPASTFGLPVPTPSIMSSSSLVDESLRKRIAKKCEKLVFKGASKDPYDP